MSKDEEARTVQLLDRILMRAVSEGVSDIHIEPRQSEVRVRFRIDGLLVERPPFPAAYRHKVASRLKVMANLDIAERRIPQDGTIRLRIDERELDVRVSTFPTEYGEKVVLRLLFQDRMGMGLDGLGMPVSIAERLREFAARAHGMVLVTGPPAAAKPTLYGMLQETDAGSRNTSPLKTPLSIVSMTSFKRRRILASASHCQRSAGHVAPRP